MFVWSFSLLRVLSRSRPLAQGDVHLQPVWDSSFRRVLGFRWALIRPRCLANQVTYLAWRHTILSRVWGGAGELGWWLASVLVLLLSGVARVRICGWRVGCGCGRVVGGHRLLFGAGAEIGARTGATRLLALVRARTTRAATSLGAALASASRAAYLMLSPTMAFRELSVHRRIHVGVHRRTGLRPDARGRILLSASRPPPLSANFARPWMACS